MKKRIIAVAFISIMVLATLSNTVFAKQSEESFKEKLHEKINNILKINSKPILSIEDLIMLLKAFLGVSIAFIGYYILAAISISILLLHLYVKPNNFLRQILVAFYEFILYE